MTIENQILTWTLDRSHRNEKKITEIKNIDSSFERKRIAI
jgi:hypothetical protein